MADFDTESADRGSRVIAQVLFWLMVVVLVCLALFGTWAWLARRDIGAFPPIFIAAMSIVLWVGIVVLIFRAWKDRQRRKQLAK